MEESSILGAAQEQYNRTTWLQQQIVDSRRKLKDYKKNIRDIYSNQIYISFLESRQDGEKATIGRMTSIMLNQVLRVRKLHNRIRRTEHRLPDLVSETYKRKRSASVLEKLGRYAASGNTHAQYQARELQNSL